MFAAFVSYSLIPVAAATGLVLPWLWLRWEMKYQTRLLRQELDAQSSIIHDQATTINAYREAVNSTMDELHATTSRG